MTAHLKIEPAVIGSKRERYIEWVRACAADGCEASARELEELLEEGPEPDDLVPLSKMRGETDAYLSMLDKGNRKFARERRGGGR